MAAVRTWRCAGCGVMVDIEYDDSDANVSSYDMPLPLGWVWVKYRSLRMPDKDTRMLGCSEACARDGIAKLGLAAPDWFE